MWISLACIFMLWNWSTFQSEDVAEDILQTDESVDVAITDDLLSFSSKSPGGATEVLFFPGGLVDPLAYAPLARKLAENGYTTHVVKMPWRLAQNGYTRINELFNLSDPSKKFVLGGHSQGAKMAAQYVYENPGTIDGLFLLGTSHPRDIDLSAMTIPTLKLYAEFDGLASVREVMDNKTKLPENTSLVMIAGGNHSQFGHMGSLLMDEEATISRDQQQQLTLKHLLSFLESPAFGVPEPDTNAAR